MWSSFRATRWIYNLLSLQSQFLHFQVGGKAGVQAQLIVQSQKAMPTTMTVQQIQQVIKHVQPQHIAHVSCIIFFLPPSYYSGLSHAWILFFVSCSRYVICSFFLVHLSYLTFKDTFVSILWSYKYNEMHFSSLMHYTWQHFQGFPLFSLLLNDVNIFNYILTSLLQNFAESWSNSVQCLAFLHFSLFSILEVSCHLIVISSTRSSLGLFVKWSHKTSL